MYLIDLNAKKKNAQTCTITYYKDKVSTSVYHLLHSVNFKLQYICVGIRLRKRENGDNG